MSTVINADFWQNFVCKYWEKRPAFFSCLFAPVFFPLDELFNTVIHMPQERTSGDRYWVSNRQDPVSRNDFRTVPLDIHGPQASDMNIEGFFQRAASEFPGSSFGINQHQLEKACPALWFRFRELVQAINGSVGAYPSDKWDIDTFMGTYQVSPLGIHKDNASVFVTGLSGRRTYYLWPYEYFRSGDDHLQTLDLNILKPHLEKAIRFDLGPGDFVYWPSSHWHLICSDGNPSVVISISAYFGKKLSDVVSNQVRNLLAEYMGDQDEQNTFGIEANAESPPQTLAKAHQFIMKAAQSGHISDALQQYWIQFLSADGMHALSPSKDLILMPDQPIRVDVRYPIQYMRSATGGLVVSANGLAITVSTQHHAALEAMLQQLNTGTVTTIVSLVSKYAKAPVTADEVTSLLGLLYKCHAFQLI